MIMGGKLSNHSSSKYDKIADNYHSLKQVEEALIQANLESSNLIVGIDFTKSNEWTGAKSFNKRSLHHLGDTPNPYEQAISTAGRMLSKYDEDGFILCFGFGDASTNDQTVFSLNQNRPCKGFDEVLACYRKIVPQIKLAGPTSFAPIIKAAIDIVVKSDGLYHFLMIIADGQVTRSINTPNGQKSPQEQATIDAIVEASKYPLSIVMVGVGDGPWDTMQQFDDNIPSRAFDNFQFVNFKEVMSRNIPSSPTKNEEEFALAALMEIPSQFKAIIELHLLSCKRGSLGSSISVPPPVRNFVTENPSLTYSQLSSFEQGAGYHRSASALQSEYPPHDNEMCYDCGKDLSSCPICHIL